MLTKISGLARTLYIVLAIVAGFVAMGAMPVALILVALGLIAGLSLPRERMVLAAATILALPTIGTALEKIPVIGTQLNAVMMNLQIAMAGSFAMAMMIILYELAMDGITGLTGPMPARRAAAI